jgi:hypothetical protein
MLTFKQSLIVLVSIMPILAIIAIGTGLSLLYWPLPKSLHKKVINDVFPSFKLEKEMVDIFQIIHLEGVPKVRRER